MFEKLGQKNKDMKKAMIVPMEIVVREEEMAVVAKKAVMEEIKERSSQENLLADGKEVDGEKMEVVEETNNSGRCVI